MIKYNLEQIKNIIDNGFIFIIPNETILIINNLIKQLDNYSNIQLLCNDDDKYIYNSLNNNNINNNKDNLHLKTFLKKQNKEKKNIDNLIYNIRFHLNKLTDNTYNIIKNNIIDILKNHNDEINIEDKTQISKLIYNILSNNKFYSNIYSKLYSELILLYPWLNIVLIDDYDNYIFKLSNLKFIEPSINYDEYCILKKENENLKSIAQFYINLISFNIISKQSLSLKLKQIFLIFLDNINLLNKENEVNELIEHICILYNKLILDDIDDNKDYYINNISIYNNLNIIIKNKDNYLTLPNKTLFKIMDILNI